jgi:hypothetical protein
MHKRIGIGNNYALAFGFSWQTIDPLESSGAQRKQLMAQGMRWEASYKSKSDEFIGATKEDFAPIKGVKTLAGAAQMAQHPRLAGRTVFIVMEQPLEDSTHNEIAVVGLLSGNIVIDDYTTTEHVKKLRVEFSEKVRRAEKSFEIVGKSITEGVVAEQFDWSDFLPTKGRLLGKKGGISAVLVKPLEPKIPPQIVWTVVFGVAILGSIWGYNSYQSKLQARKAAAVLLAQKNSGPARYSESVAVLLMQPVLSANTTFAALRDSIKEFPTKRKGWHLKSIKCGADGMCEAAWLNYLNLANYRDFVIDAPKEWGTVVLNNVGDELSHQLPLKLPTRSLPAQDKWPEQRAFLMKGFSQWQKYWVLNFHPELIQAPVLMAVPSGVDEKAAAGYSDAVWAMRWTIKQTPWYLSEAFDKSVDEPEISLPDSVTVDSITIKFEKDQSVLFDAEGQIYVRK